MTPYRTFLWYMRGLLVKGWTKQANARNYLGGKEGLLSPDATSFCVMGAATRTRHELAGKINANVTYYEVLNRIDRASRSFGDIVKWNDAPKRTLEDVLGLIDRLIAEAPTT